MLIHKNAPVLPSSVVDPDRGELLLVEQAAAKCSLLITDQMIYSALDKKLIETHYIKGARNKQKAVYLGDVEKHFSDPNRTKSRRKNKAQIAAEQAQLAASADGMFKPAQEVPAPEKVSEFDAPALSPLSALSDGMLREALNAIGKAPIEDAVSQPEPGVVAVPDPDPLLLRIAHVEECLQRLMEENKMLVKSLIEEKARVTRLTSDTSQAFIGVRANFTERDQRITKLEDAVTNISRRPALLAQDNERNALFEQLQVVSN